MIIVKRTVFYYNKPKRPPPSRRGKGLSLSGVTRERRSARCTYLLLLLLLQKAWGEGGETKKLNKINSKRENYENKVTRARTRIIMLRVRCTLLLSSRTGPVAVFGCTIASFPAG